MVLLRQQFFFFNMNLIEKKKNFSILSRNHLLNKTQKSGVCNFNTTGWNVQLRIAF